MKVAVNEMAAVDTESVIAVVYREPPDQSVPADVPEYLLAPFDAVPTIRIVEF